MNLELLEQGLYVKTKDGYFYKPVGRWKDETGSITDIKYILHVSFL